ncbi:OmpA/MotB family protein [Conexibacter arvalis]|uniref:Chemotaxis protein MotB n=1 Tax=Conexibacter arvalis TaxID=912552 RepID=A0A840IA98_9ACTN|nr:flagellar motor protein MotB [Conexibacter arvalis]MBB4660998.1 chemotaxis protein MotB [Conexibacter arvalis]
MSAPKRGGRRRGRGGAHGAGHGGSGDERWLITYADMLTLLLALFIVLYSISSLNTSKFEALQTSLRDAFSGKIISGGEGIVETGVSATRETPSSVIPNITPPTPQIATPRDRTAAAALDARREDDSFRRLKAQIEAYAKAHGLEDQVEAVVARRGLVVRLLTDRVLFDSGFADLKAQGRPLLAHVGNLVKIDEEHPVLVEGHTDDVPISTSRFASNWELSTARATEVVRFLIERGVPGRRIGASGYADQHPLSSNGSDRGRARNRRVEVVLQRINTLPSDRDAAPDTSKGLTP